jgi:hypothetical protein
MALKLEVIENYVVYSDTITGDAVGEYPINHCVYTEEADRFEIKEQIDNGRLTITKADLAAGKWVDAGAVAYTEATMRDFLRANTGFKSASGGSGATQPKIYKALLNQSGTNNPTVTEIRNDLGAPIVWTRSDVGIYIGTLANAFNGNVVINNCNIPFEGEGSTLFTYASLTSGASGILTGYYTFGKVDNNSVYWLTANASLQIVEATTAKSNLNTETLISIEIFE